MYNSDLLEQLRNVEDVENVPRVSDSEYDDFGVLAMDYPVWGYFNLGNVTLTSDTDITLHVVLHCFDFSQSVSNHDGPRFHGELVFLPDPDDLTDDVRETANQGRGETDLMDMYSSGYNIRIIDDSGESWEECIRKVAPNDELFNMDEVEDVLDKRQNRRGTTGWTLLNEWCVE